MYRPLVFSLLNALLIVLIVFNAVALTASEEGRSLVVTPPQIRVVMLQGRNVTIPLSFIGNTKNVNWSLIFVQGMRNGIKIHTSPIYIGDVIRGINITISALRPGGYYYALYITLPVKTKGRIVVHPVIVVPIRIIVPGVRVSLVRVHSLADRGVAHVCIGLTPVGLYVVNRTSFKTVVRLYVDDRLYITKHFILKSGKVWCVTLGPFKRGSRHRVRVIAETPGYSIDGISFDIVIGRVTVNARLTMLHKPITVLVFGGLVEEGYVLDLEFNTSSCSVILKASLAGHAKILQSRIEGRLGEVNKKRLGGKISFYMPPLLPLPFTIVDNKLYARIACLGLDKPRVISVSKKSVVLDAGVTGLYVAMLVASLYALRRARRRSRRHEE